MGSLAAAVQSLFLSGAKAVANVAVHLAALGAMTVAELRSKYENVFGEPTRSHNKDYLRKKIAWRIQEIAEGGLSERARARINELAVGAPDHWQAPARRRMAANGRAENAQRDSRLPVAGTVLSRTYKGAEHEVRPHRWVSIVGTGLRSIG